ncbi:hypothetical protein JFU47_07405 [Pseudomonas sp. TH39(2020)]|nr:hypothetical protein [Pseudomonas sp. TH39(2020)]
MFNDTQINTDERFTIGIEEVSGKHYVSIPVSNRMVDYDEHYQTDRASYNLYLTNSTAALEFVKRCRNRELDKLLFFKPGTDRGTPS